jgi:hypothetical protein
MIHLKTRSSVLGLVNGERPVVGGTAGRHFFVATVLWSLGVLHRTGRNQRRRMQYPPAAEWYVDFFNVLKITPNDPTVANPKRHL